MPFWTEHTFQPKRASRFEVKLRLVDAVKSCATQIEPKIKEISWFNIVSAEKPSFSTQMAKFKYLNTEVRFAQPPVWNPIKIVILDVVGSDILQIIKDSQNEYMYKKTNYKLLSAPVDIVASANQVDIYQLDENGKKIELWTLERVFISSIRQSILNYNEESLSTIELTLEYDDAHLIAKPEYLDSDFVGQPTEEILTGSTNYKPEVEECLDTLESCSTNQDNSRSQSTGPPKETKHTEKPLSPQPPDNITASADVLFDFDSSDIKEEGRIKLDEIAERLKKSGEKLDITGNTDKIGSEEYNQKLSQERADAVMKYLLESGVSEDQLTAKGAGESNANQDKDVTREQRAQDRNVKFSFSGGEEENLDLPEGSYQPGDENIPPEDTGSVTGFENTEIPQRPGEGIERREPESTLQPTSFDELENAAQQSLIEVEETTEQAQEENTISPVYSGSDIKRVETENYLQSTSTEELEDDEQQSSTEGQSFIPEPQTTSDSSPSSNSAQTNPSYGLTTNEAGTSTLTTPGGNVTSISADDDARAAEFDKIMEENMYNIENGINDFDTGSSLHLEQPSSPTTTSVQAETVSTSQDQSTQSTSESPFIKNTSYGEDGLVTIETSYKDYNTARDIAQNYGRIKKMEKSQDGSWTITYQDLNSYLTE